MGSSCCSKVKEPTEITILKPEKNIRSSNQNRNNSEQNNTNNYECVVGRIFFMVVSHFVLYS